MTNTGSVPATDAILNVTLPAYATHVPNSISIINNAGGAVGDQTDASGDDLGEASGGALTVRLGTGASASAGGDIAYNASVTVKYRVQVNSVIPNLIILTNKADVNFRSASNAAVVLNSSSTLNLIASPKHRLLLPIANKQ